MYLVIFWGISSCVFEGPFENEESATSYLADYEPDKSGEIETGIVIGPIPQVGEIREF